MSEHKLMTARKCDEYTAQGLPVWEVQGYGTSSGAGHDVLAPWFDVRLTLPDGARVDVLAVLRGDSIAIEDAQADPPLPLAGLAALASALDAPLQEACASVTSVTSPPASSSPSPTPSPSRSETLGPSAPDATGETGHTPAPAAGPAPVTEGATDTAAGNGGAEGRAAAADREPCPAPEAGVLPPPETAAFPAREAGAFPVPEGGPVLAPETGPAIGAAPVADGFSVRAADGPFGPAPGAG
ncbi:DUF6214 family protein, partial [Streptomyces fuscigenes]|uniref:DUF6214 family protein n=1 Tax=Streptomyces fuscigenes TaxID=1528880 RepID=UPI001F3C7B21